MDAKGDDHIQALFRDRNVRCTPQRAALYRALRSCRTHPTAEELFHMARPGLTRLSLATVYNTLDALCHAGLCRKVPTTNGCCRFDANTADHMHLRYADTGEIRDVPDDLAAQIQASLPADVLRRLERELSVSIDRISLQFTVRRASGESSDDAT